MAGAQLIDIANEIAAATRVISDAAGAQPGRPVNVSVLPGFSPALGSTLSSVTQSLTGGILGSVTGTIAGSLLVDKVDFSVTYEVTREDGHPPIFKRTPLAALPEALDVAFLLQPPVGENTLFTPPTVYHISVTIRVAVEGLNPPITKKIDVPVRMPALEVPAIAVIGRHAMTGASFADFDIPLYYDNDPNWLMVMVRAGSPVESLGPLISTINSLMETLQTLQSLLDFTGDFSTTLKLIATGVNKIPVVFFRTGNWADMGDPGGFDEEASSLILIGLSDLKFTLYQSDNFSKGGLGEDAYATFAVNPTPVPNSPLGCLVVPTFSGRNFDNDDDDLNDAADSARFGDVP